MSEGVPRPPDEAVRTFLEDDFLVKKFFLNASISEKK